MADILLWILAAGGLLLFAWCMLGWMLIPASQQTITILYVEKPAQMEHDVRLWLWLRAIGVQAGILLVTLCAEDVQMTAAAKRFCGGKQNVYICTREELAQRVKMEQT